MDGATFARRATLSLTYLRRLADQQTRALFAALPIASNRR
jgi:hypothetical protein